MNGRVSDEFVVAPSQSARPTDFVLSNPPYGLITYMGARSFSEAVQAKLSSIDTTQSVELKRFVMLAAHECGHYQMKWKRSTKETLLYDAYGIPAIFREKHIDIFQSLANNEADHLHSPAVYYIHQWLLGMVFDLIDRVVDYWNDIALARCALRRISGAFRQLTASFLKFKASHTPLRLFPSSLHPIESAA